MQVRGQKPRTLGNANPPAWAPVGRWSWGGKDVAGGAGGGKCPMAAGTGVEDEG